MINTIFTCKHNWCVHLSPKVVDLQYAVRAIDWWFKSVPNEYKLNFKWWSFATSDKILIRTIRESSIFWTILFENDKNWNNITDKVIKRMEDKENAVDAEIVVNPYKLLPAQVLSKLSLDELSKACKEFNIEIKEWMSKKEISELLVK